MNAAYEMERDERLQVLSDLKMQVQALDAVLESRSTYESVSHQVHKVSIATLAIANQLERCSPLYAELNALRNAGRGDDVIEAVLASLPTALVNEGAPTVPQLLNRFKMVKKVGREAALMPENSGMVGHLVGSFLAKVTMEPKGPVQGSGAEAVFSRTTHFLECGDLESAVKQVETLTGYPAEVVSDWLREAKSRLLLEQGAKVMKAHASLLAASCS